jgi:hypothetical protein
MWHGPSSSRDREFAAFETDGRISSAAVVDRDPFESIGTVVSFARNREIYGQNDPPLYVYKMISGAVRTCKHFADGRRQVGGFYLADDVFGLEMVPQGCPVWRAKLGNACAGVSATASMVKSRATASPTLPRHWRQKLLRLSPRIYFRPHSPRNKCSRAKGAVLI